MNSLVSKKCMPSVQKSLLISFIGFILAMIMRWSAVNYIHKSPMNKRQKISFIMRSVIGAITAAVIINILCLYNWNKLVNLLLMLWTISLVFSASLVMLIPFIKDM